MNDLETFKELLCGMAEAKSTTELWFKQAAFMLWCGDNPDKLAALIAAHPQTLVDAEAAAQKICDFFDDPGYFTVQSVIDILQQHSQERAGWQKIETAPRDARSIIGYCDKDESVAIIWWTGGDGWRVWNRRSTSFPATHWMPLPESPKEK